MKLNKLKQVTRINEATAKAGAIINNPRSTPNQIAAAIASVDALHDPGASRAIRTYADTVSLNPPEERQQLQQLLVSSREEQETLDRLTKLKAFSQS